MRARVRQQSANSAISGASPTDQQPDNDARTRRSHRAVPRVPANVVVRGLGGGSTCGLRLRFHLLEPHSNGGKLIGGEAKQTRRGIARSGSRAPECFLRGADVLVNRGGENGHIGSFARSATAASVAHNASPWRANADVTA